MWGSSGGKAVLGPNFGDRHANTLCEPLDHTDASSCKAWPDLVLGLEVAPQNNLTVLSWTSLSSLCR